MVIEGSVGMTALPASSKGPSPPPDAAVVGPVKKI